VDRPNYRLHVQPDGDVRLQFKKPWRRPHGVDCALWSRHAFQEMPEVSCRAERDPQGSAGGSGGRTAVPWWKGSLTKNPPSKRLGAQTVEVVHQNLVLILPVAP
jgi:hypothetical protein